MIKSLIYYPRLIPRFLLTPLIILSLLGILIGFMDSIALAMIIPLSEMIVNVDIDYSTIPLLASVRGFFEDRNVPFTIVSVIVLILLFQSTRILGMYVQGWLGAKYSASYEHNMRKSTMNAYAYMPWKNYVKHDSGEVYFDIFRISHFATSVYSVYGRIISASLTALIYLVTAFYAAWQLSLMAVFYSLFAGLLLSWLLVYARKLGEKRLPIDVSVHEKINQLVKGMKYIRVSGLIDYQRDRVIKSSKSLADINESIGINLALFKSISEALFFVALIGILFISTLFSVISSGALLLFALLFFRIFQQVRTLQSSMQAFLQNEPYVRKMHTIQKSNENYNNIKILKPNPERIIAIKKNIRVRNVSYSYTNDVNVLRDVDLEIKAGEHTAVVGLSGVGKTTLLDLIVGLLKPTKGEITYGDQILNQSELEHLRNRVSYVPQGGVLFTGTLLENIMFGTDSLDNKKLKKSLEIANVYEFLDTMPQGLETQMGEGGFTLSGGQRQRLILARALYRSPEIIILDEATSELDSVTQNTFIKALNQLKGYATILTVAHRLSNVQDANVVYVIRDGAVVESGNIDELILLNGYFVKMYNSELGLKGK